MKVVEWERGLPMEYTALEHVALASQEVSIYGLMTRVDRKGAISI